MFNLINVFSTFSYISIKLYLMNLSFDLKFETDSLANFSLEVNMLQGDYEILIQKDSSNVCST